jgi:hypothetical protein
MNSCWEDFNPEKNSFTLSELSTEVNLMQVWHFLSPPRYNAKFPILSFVCPLQWMHLVSRCKALTFLSGIYLVVKSQ